MATYQEQIANIKLQADKIAKGVSTLSQAEKAGLKILPGTTVSQASQYLLKRPNTSISAPEIGSSSPITTPAPQTTPNDFSLRTTLGSLGNSYQSNQTQTTTPATTPTTTTPTPPTAPLSTRDTIINRSLEIMGLQQKQGDKTLQYQKEEGVFDKQKQARELENKFIARQKALQDNIVRMEKNAGGVSAGGISSEVESYRQAGERELANIAIEQKVAQGAYSEAVDIVTKKIDAEFEPLKNELSTLGTIYNFVQNDLSESEKMKAQADLANKQADLANLRTTKIEISKALIENKRPDLIAQLDQFPDASSMIKFAGQAGIPVSTQLDEQLKRAQITKLNAEAADVGIPTITNPQASQYAGVLNVILGSGQFTKDQKKTVINAVNNGQDPFTVIKNQAKNIMGQSEATTLLKYETARDQINGIDTLLNQYYAKGGKTGILSGNYEKVINNLGQVNNPDLVGIATNISSALQIYRNAVSGTAYSVQEGKDIASIFPGINKSEGLNKAVIAGRLQSFDTTIDSMYTNTLGNSYSSLKNATQTSSTPSTTSNSNLSDEDAYALYLQATGGSSTTTPTQTTAPTPTGQTQPSPRRGYAPFAGLSYKSPLNFFR